MTTFRMQRAASFAATFALMTALSPAMAATEIAGDAKSLSIRLENASIDEALKSLSAFDVSYRAPGALSKPLNGTYRGPLKEVVRSLLTGYDFVLTTRGASIEVAVLGKSNKSADIVIERGKTAAAKPPALEVARPAAPIVNVQEAMDGGRKPANPVPAQAVESETARPIVVAQNSSAAMPILTPVADGPAPTPIPASGDDLPTPRPDMSGTAPMPMPTPNAEGPVPMPTPNANGPMPTPIPPAPDAQGPMPMPAPQGAGAPQPAPTPTPTPTPAPAPKPN